MDTETIYDFNDQDKKIFSLMEEGYKDWEIAKRIHKSAKFVESRKTNARWILNAKNAVQLMAIVIRKNIIILFLLLSVVAKSQIDSLAGGRMQYKCLGASNYTPGDSAYFIGIYLYKKKLVTDIAPYFGYPDSITVFVWNNDNTSLHATRRQALANVVDLAEDTIFCLSAGLPSLEYTRALYGVTVDLTLNLMGYTAATQICCRLNGYANIANNQGATYWVVIPPISIPDDNPDFSN